MKKVSHILLAFGMAFMVGFGLNYERLYNPDLYFCTDEVEQAEEGEEKIGDSFGSLYDIDGGDGDDTDNLPHNLSSTPIALSLAWLTLHLTALYQASSFNSCCSSQFPETFSRPGFFILYHSFKADLAG